MSRPAEDIIDWKAWGNDHIVALVRAGNLPEFDRIAAEIRASMTEYAKHTSSLKATQLEEAIAVRRAELAAMSDSRTAP